MAKQPNRVAPSEPLEADYFQAEQLLAQGQLKEAAALCERMLMANPFYHRGYFLLSKLYSVVGNTDKSLANIEKAIQHAPSEEPVYFYFRGNGHLLKDQLPEAEADFLKTLALDRSMALAALLLGTTYIKMQRYDEAEARLLAARKLGMKRESVEQLGVLYQARGEWQKAGESYDALITMAPDYALGYQHRAGLQATQKNWGKVIEDAERGLSLNPNMKTAWYLFSLALYNEKRYAEAVAAAEKAVNLDQRYREAWDILAQALQRNGQVAGSIECLEMMLERFPDDVNIYRTLPSLLMATHRVEDAKKYLEKALTLAPDDRALQHFKAALADKPIDTADEEYVRGLFDAYAEEFDFQLQEVLSYHTPELLANVLRDVLKNTQGRKAPLTLLDLGCGTGLGAVAMEDFTTQRVGIDLSEKMIEKARDRKLYDRLETTEIVRFLQEDPTQFDLIAAVDVFVYIGNLASVFETAAARLTPGGYFAFSVERADDAKDGFTLRPSGRFAHAKGYLEQLAERYGYRILHISSSDLRKELGKPIEGYLVVMERT